MRFSRLAASFLIALASVAAPPMARSADTFTSNGYWIHPQVEEIPGLKTGPFVRLADGRILTAEGTMCCISGDGGKAWSESPIFADPGRFDIRVERVLLRTRSGAIILAFANVKERSGWNWDEDVAWRHFKPTTIDASSAPGMLKRLASGRLILIWNRRFPEGRSEYPLSGGDGNWSEVKCSNHREELSIMFSDDDGKTWSDPVVIAKVTEKSPTRNLSYPRFFEASPGEIWITTTYSGFAGYLSIRLSEKDFAGQ